MFPASVSRLRLFFGLLLAVLWLPVTSHCRLEAAGFQAADDCCAAEEPAGECKDDVCPTVEDALYKESVQSLKVAAPEVSLCFACLALVPAPAADEPGLSRFCHAPPPELRVAWQFIARAAPPARAPSLNT